MQNDRWRLRPDLEIIPAEGLGGRPSVLVHDPVAATFDRVEWPGSDIVELLARPLPLGSGELLAALARRSPIKPTEREVGGFVRDLALRGWLAGSEHWPPGRKPSVAAGIAAGIIAAAGKILFFKIPLLRPAGFLRATAGLAGLAVSPLVLTLLALCGLAGLYLALPRWEEYWRDSLGGFGLASAPSFALAIIAVKAAHEFAHAYAATRGGAKVGSMGIAFFLLMPLPYTDVTDAWRLPWPGRTRVAVAGMTAELALAGVALLLWALSPPGAAAEALARLSSVAVASTALTNLNPGPRFDGYYLLVCLFRLENLRARAAGLLRSAIWRGLFGIAPPAAEEAAGGRMGMLAFAAYAVLYRFSLGCALAAMVYYTLPKAAAIPAAGAMCFLFLGIPVLTEAGFLWRSRKGMKPTVPLFLLALLLACLGVWVAGAWPRRVAFPAVTRAASEEAVRAARAGVVRAVTARRGEAVRIGAELAVLAAAEDEPALRQARWAVREAELAEEQAWRGEGDAGRGRTGMRAAEAARRRAELAGLELRTTFLRVVAPGEGRLEAWDRDLAEGVSVARGQLLGWVVAPGAARLAGYVDVGAAARLDVNEDVKFFPDSGEAAIPGRIVRIEESRPEELGDPELAAALGAAQSDGGGLVLARPYVRIEIRLERPLPRVGQTGTVWGWTEPRSLLAAGIDWLRGLAIRESSF